MAKTEKANDEEEVVSRLLDEVRQQAEILTALKRELSQHDLEKLSLKGAVSFLVKQKNTLDELKRIISNAHGDPEVTLQKLEKTLKDNE